MGRLVDLGRWRSLTTVTSGKMIMVCAMIVDLGTETQNTMVNAHARTARCAMMPTDPKEKMTLDDTVQEAPVAPVAPVAQAVQVVQVKVPTRLAGCAQ